jgi:hypothetical protein
MFRLFMPSSSVPVFARKIVEAFHRYVHAKIDISIFYINLFWCVNFGPTASFENCWQVWTRQKDFLDEGVRWIRAIMELCGNGLRCGVADFGLFTGGRRMLDWFVQWKVCLGFFLMAWTKKLIYWQHLKKESAACTTFICMDVIESRRLACMKKCFTNNPFNGAHLCTVANVWYV